MYGYEYLIEDETWRNTKCDTREEVMIKTTTEMVEQRRTRREKLSMEQ